MKKWKAGAFVLSLLLPFLISSCASTKVSSEEETEVVKETLPVSIPLPEKTNRGYFSSISEEVISLVEKGSPLSLRQAVSLVHKSADEVYSEQEKVLIALCSDIMKMAYPGQTFSWETPEAPTSNQYLGAMESAKKKIYDSSTGNTDFLTRILPSMVLFVTDDSSAFFSTSQSSLQEALEINENSVLANYLMGKLYASVKDWESSLVFYEKALSQGEEITEIINCQSFSYMMAGKKEEALTASEKVLENQAQNMEALEVAAKTAYSMGDMEKAESYVLRVLQVEPERKEFVLLRARILIDRKDFIRASSLLDAYSKTDVKSRDYLFLRARLLKEWNKNGSGSAEYIQQALILYPDDIELLSFASSLASSYNLKINNMSAYELSRKVLELDPENKEARIISIEELCKSYRWSEAYELSSKLIEEPSSSVSERCTHVEICLALGRYTEANRLALQLYQKDQSNEDIQQVYLKMLVATGMKNQAQTLISSLMNGASMKMRSFLFYERSFYGNSEDEILSDLRSSLTANPRNKDSLFRLYKIYYNKDDWKKAQYYLKQVVALNPSDSDMLRLNAQLDVLQGK